MFSTNLTCFPFCDHSPTPLAEDASVKKHATLSSAVEETAAGVATTTATVPMVREVIVSEVTMTTEAVAESTTVLAVEAFVPAEATMTTEVVMEADMKMLNDVAEASGQGGRTSDHRARKEVVAGVPLGSQRTVDAVITEEEEE